MADKAHYPVKYQQVFHLNPDNLLPYEAMTYPSLRARWQSQPQRGELLGISASVAGEMVGFAVTERYAQTDTEQACGIIIIVCVARLSPSRHRHGL